MGKHLGARANVRRSIARNALLGGCYHGIAQRGLSRRGRLHGGIFDGTAQRVRIDARNVEARRNMV
ncbi:MAG: hypothetical protein CMD92_07100 [Gammaproteobacteria bacterium]|nr:hypothetical protein [Gammaproteobacteria bacterium]